MTAHPEGPPTSSAIRRRFPKKALLFLVALALATAFAVGWRATQAKKDAPKAAAKAVLEFTPADVAIVELRSLTRTLALSGSLSPMLQATVRAKVPGEVRKVTVREGDRVAEGQVVALIDTADLQAKVDAQAAALEEHRARAGLAEKNRENTRQLLHQKFISQNAFDTAQSAHDAAAAGVKSAQAQLRMAERAMQDAVVRAPFNGSVARRMASVGEKVGVDSPLFTIVDLSRMEIEAPAPASDVPAVKVGQGARFRVDGFGERVFEGRIERINPAAEPGSRSITLYVSVDNRDGALKGGMFAMGQLVLDKSAPAPVVPASAVREEAGQAYVFTIEDGRLARRPVALGLREEGYVQVRSGLEQGLPVVRARITDLKPGAPAILKTVVGLSRDGPEAR